MDPNSSSNQNNNQPVATSHVVIPAPNPNPVVSDPLPQPIAPIIETQPQVPINPLPVVESPVIESVNPFSSQVPHVVPLSNQPPVEPVSNVGPPLIQPTTEPVSAVVSPMPDPLLSQKPLIDNTVREINDVPKKGKSNKKIAAVILIILFIVALPITIFVSQQQQNTQSGAAVSLTPETVIAVFNGQNITEKDVETVAKEQYDANAIDTQALKDATDILIERKVLDYEKAQKSINVSQDEIAKKEADGFDLVQAPYEVLKDKVTIANTKNWQAFSIGFWLPPKNELSDLSQEEKTTRTKQLEDGLKAMDDAKDQLQTKKDPLDIARDLARKYPSLAPILGVNGYLLKELGGNANLSDVTSPKIYTFESSNSGQSFFDTLYSMKNAGQIKKAISSNESGGSTIKLIKANIEAQYNTYEAWLAARKTTLVNLVYSL